MGTRLAEETEVRPKPMVEIGGRPIMWHIMRYYAHHGIDDFVIALGYKGDYIRRYFADYHINASNLRVELGSGELETHGGTPESWTVDLIETGRWTNTGGRIKRLVPHMGDETFMLTWGDGLSNVPIDELVAFHRSHGRLLTVTAVHPPARFGQLVVDDEHRVVEFTEKPLDTGWINGAFFVAEPGIAEYIEGDETLFEKEPMEGLAEDGELMAYRHEGFWHPMDTLRDKVSLERLWDGGSAPWKVWS